MRRREKRKFLSSRRNPEDGEGQVAGGSREDRPQRNDWVARILS